VRAARGLGTALLLLVACRPPAEEDLELLRARNAAAQGRYDWARLHYAKDYERHPEHLGSLRELAISWLSGYQQSLSTGAERLREYVDRAPGDAVAARQLVRTLMLLGEKDEARERAARLGDDPESELVRAQALLDVDPGGARLAIERALAGDPEDPRAHATAAEAYERAGDAARAVSHAQRALELDPLQYSTLYRLARLCQRRGEADRAARYLALHQRVTRLLEVGSLSPVPASEGLEILDAAERDLGGGGFDLRKRRVQLLFAAGRLHDAVEAARTLSRDPRASLTDRLELATWTGDHGRRADARELFEAIQRGSPGSAGAVASIAQLEIEAGQLPQARGRLTEALAGDPGFARYHYLLGRIESLEGRTDAAVVRYQRAVALAPWEWTWRTALADVLLSQRRVADFRALLSDAPEEAPGLAEYRERHAAELSGPTRAR
jgi:tetratricopeptide (TPR) repeat protein